jgi:predicted secreted protein
MARILVDERWNGKRIEMKVGDEIRIELHGIGATGYAWHFDKLDQDLFQMRSEERKGEESKSGESVGTPTLYTWVIKAKKTGTSVIEMSYYRVWERKESAIRQFEVKVTIAP